MDIQLRKRLRAVGVSPDSVTDPAAAWRRLHDAEGRRATLLDRYELEVAMRGIAMGELDDELRARLAREVLSARDPGFEVMGGSERVAADPVEVVPYDHNWPSRFEAWRARLADHLAASAVRIEHVGSTAVPGLAAKPVIDIHVAVADVEDEAAYVNPIEHSGVAFRSRETGHRYFRPAADRPREVQVHVSTIGSQWEQDHLLFRDFLRANAEVRQAYGELKLDLARQFRDDRIAYNEAKSRFIVASMDSARRWRAGQPGE